MSDNLKLDVENTEDVFNLLNTCDTKAKSNFYSMTLDVHNMIINYIKKAYLKHMYDKIIEQYTELIRHLISNVSTIWKTDLMDFNQYINLIIQLLQSVILKDSPNYFIIIELSKLNEFDIDKEFHVIYGDYINKSNTFLGEYGYDIVTYYDVIVGYEKLEHIDTSHDINRAFDAIEEKNNLQQEYKILTKPIIKREINILKKQFDDSLLKLIEKMHNNFNKIRVSITNFFSSVNTILLDTNKNYILNIPQTEMINIQYTEYSTLTTNKNTTYKVSTINISKMSLGLKLNQQRELNSVNISDICIYNESAKRHSIFKSFLKK